MPANGMKRSKAAPSFNSRSSPAISDGYRSSSTCASNAAPADPTNGTPSVSGRSSGSAGMGRGR